MKVVSEDETIITGVNFNQRRMILSPGKLEKEFIDDDVSTASRSLRLDATAPSTPRRRPSPELSTPPPAKANSGSALMRAIRANSVDLAAQVIQAEPDVLRFPFWDHGKEPPLCFAVRHLCKASIIEFLLLHGAEPSAKDSRGCSAADILISMRSRMFDPAFYEDLDAVEKLLNVAPKDWQTLPDTQLRDIGWSFYAREDPPWFTFANGSQKSCVCRRGGA
jgi:hypothetical protein